MYEFDENLLEIRNRYLERTFIIISCDTNYNVQIKN